METKMKTKLAKVDLLHVWVVIGRKDVEKELIRYMDSIIVYRTTAEEHVCRSQTISYSVQLTSHILSTFD